MRAGRTHTVGEGGTRTRFILSFIASRAKSTLNDIAQRVVVEIIVFTDTLRDGKGTRVTGTVRRAHITLRVHVCLTPTTGILIDTATAARDTRSRSIGKFTRRTNNASWTQGAIGAPTSRSITRIHTKGIGF